MDRQMVYPGAIPLETDILSAQKNDMIGLAKLAAAVLGTTTQVNGLGCAPNSPAALNVVVSPGEIYSLQNVDGTAYSSLAADTTHQILKQGILLDAVILSAPAPVTAGQSVNYLVQATYQDSDTGAVVLPYYNASNPSQAFSGPNGAGTTNNTVRKGLCTVSIKPGIAATTGSQATPAPDAGNVGLYVVTVANGQTTVTAPNIATAAGAPFISPLSLYAALAGATFTGPVSGPTPAQFDTSTKFATMAALQRALGNFSGELVINADITLSAAHAGVLIVGGSGTPFTATLPLSSTLRAGSVIPFFNSGAGVLTVARQGADVLDGVAGATSVTLKQSDSLYMESLGGGTWRAVGGSAQLPFSSIDTRYAKLAGLATQTFAAANAVGTNDVVPLGQADGRYAKLAGLLTQVFRVANGVAANDAVALGQFAFTNGANGVFKIPMVGGNLIFQWGQTGSIAAAAAISVTFPIAFPNFCFFANYIGDANNSAGNANETVVGKNTVGFSSTNFNAATANFNWVAIGW